VEELPKNPSTAVIAARTLALVFVTLLLAIAATVFLLSLASHLVSPKGSRLSSARSS